MCGRVVMAIDSNTLVQISRARTFRNQQGYRPSYNMPPTRGVPCIFRENSKSKENELECMKFGMKNNDNIDVVNARSETIRFISMFKDMISKYNRCAVIKSNNLGDC
jgi:putative SOS response-associated peptidase YedK